MGELRKHYFLEKYVEISEDRGKRPHEYDNHGPDKKKNLSVIDHNCPFCPGNEKSAPPEKGRIGNPWRMRWFSNKFPAVSKEGQSKLLTDNNFFTYSSNYGEHEVIVNVREHNRDISMLSISELNKLIAVYESRIDDLSSPDDIDYVSVFKNDGEKAGASLVHDHSQVISLNFLPPKIKREYNYIKNYDGCPHCDVINIEKNSHRKCFENNHAVAFTPYASLFPYEIWLYSKRHINRFKELSRDELNDFSSIFKKILRKLRSFHSSYNYYIKYGDDENDMHSHIVFTPRLAQWAGFEFSTGVTINSISPEVAASFYRGDNSN